VRRALAVLLVGVAGLAACASPPPRAEPQASPPPTLVSDAPPAAETGGFDGARAFAHVEKLVAIGPRPPASDGIRRAQEYIRSRLRSYGCAVEDDDFTASTPRGRIPMKNLIAKIPGQSPPMVLLLSHYDTWSGVPGFVGANDGGSSTALLLELGRQLCGSKRKLTLWLVFTDGEEAYVEWSGADGTYGSRNLAAKMALSGELKRVRAVIVADLIGDKNLRVRREENSTRWLTDLVWKTAKRLGYAEHFLDEDTSIEDDHIPFLRRGVPAVDIIDLDYPHWHTAQDTLDKVSARSIAVVGHVILEVLGELEKAEVKRP
jgi:hypothetical protein